MVDISFTRVSLSNHSPLLSYCPLHEFTALLMGFAFGEYGASGG